MSIWPILVQNNLKSQYNIFLNFKDQNKNKQNVGIISITNLLQFCSLKKYIDQ
jgi:hypothetical protein